MKSIVLLVVYGVVGLLVVAEGTDYCSKTLCGDAKHIACNNTGKFAKICKDAKMGEMTTTLIADIVKKFNELRQIAANGKVPGLNSASRMSSMQWDSELADLAALNVKQCLMAHDKCHNTVKFPQSGQNLAETMSTAKQTGSAKDILLPLIGSWWSESQNTTMKEINSFPSSFPAVIGHLTVMLVDSNKAVGCAFSTFIDSNGWYDVLLACNFAKTNIINGKSYTSGKTASQCKTGTNPKFPGLCSINEKY